MESDVRLVTLTGTRGLEIRILHVCILFFSGVLYENGSTTIRPEDMTIIEMKVTDNRHCYKYVAFGFIKSANRLNRNERRCCPQ